MESNVAALAWELAESVVFRTIDETEGCLMHVATREFFTLNRTGIFITRELQKGRTAEHIAAKLSRVFSVEKKAALNDTLEFVERMRSSGLIRARDGSENC